MPLGLYALSVAGCRIARRLGSIRLPVGGFVVRCFLVKSGACMAGAWIRGEPKEWSLLQAAALACLWVDQSQGMLRLLVGHLLRLLESGFVGRGLLVKSGACVAGVWRCGVHMDCSPLLDRRAHTSPPPSPSPQPPPSLAIAITAAAITETVAKSLPPPSPPPTPLLRLHHHPSSRPRHRLRRRLHGRHHIGFITACDSPHWVDQRLDGADTMGP